MSSPLLKWGSFSFVSGRIWPWMSEKLMWRQNSPCHACLLAAGGIQNKENEAFNAWFKLFFILLPVQNISDFLLVGNGTSRSLCWQNIWIPIFHWGETGKNWHTLTQTLCSHWICHPELGGTVWQLLELCHSPDTICTWFREVLLFWEFLSPTETTQINFIW